MRGVRVLAFTLAGIFLGLSSLHASFIFDANLTGDQEVPPVMTLATGSATLELNDGMDRLEIFIQLNGLDLDGLQTPADPNDNVLAMHIHAAPPGVNGGIVFGFISPNNDLNGDLMIDPIAGTVFSAWDLPEGNAGTTLAAQLANLFAGGLYINVHTPDHTGGEIRGQIERVSEPATLTLLLLGAFALRRRSY